MTFDEIVGRLPKPYYRDTQSDIAIYCADCRDILPLIPDKAVDLVLTDPPYGQGIAYGDSYNDDPDDYWSWFLPAIERLKHIGNILIFTHKVSSLRYVKGWDWIGVWNKPGNFGARIGKSAILPNWEPIYFYGIHLAGVYGEYSPDVFTFNPVRAVSSVIGRKTSMIGQEKWQKSSNFSNHPCPKPVSLFQKLAQVFSPNGGIILDPFLGSGTTAYCAKKLGRKCIGIEISEEYCQIAVKRLSQMVMPLTIDSNPKGAKLNEKPFQLWDDTACKGQRG